MQLFTAWGDSLKLLQPKNLILFLLVTAKTIVQTYKTWLTYFWWLPFLAGALFWYLDQDWALKLPELVVLLTVAYLFSFTFFLAVRPSMRRKNMAYFFGYLKHGLILGLILAAGSSLMKIPMGLWSRLIIPTCFVALVTFFVLFLLDSRATLSDCAHSFVRAAAMVIYNYPILLLGVFIFHVLSAALQVTFGSMVYWYTGPGALGFILKLISMISLYVYYSFFVCLCTNFYIKKMHDQFNLYFSVKEEV